MLRPFALAAALALVPGVTFAQTQPTQQPPPPASPAPAARQAESGKPPLRIVSITLTGNQTCPPPKNPDEEVVVCGHIGDPYRIPKELRDQRPIPPQNQSWVNRVAAMDEVGRRAGGLPNTCSATGSGGQTGCAKLRAEQWAAERAQKKRDAAAVP